MIEDEPLRCLNCQKFGMGHLAGECQHPAVCAHCGHAHKTWDCTDRGNPAKYRCINCQQAGHASWDPHCPEFIKRKNERRHAKGAHKYFVTNEEWTWEKSWKGDSPFMTARELMNPNLTHPPPHRTGQQRIPQEQIHRMNPQGPQQNMIARNPTPRGYETGATLETMVSPGGRAEMAAAAEMAADSGHQTLQIIMHMTAGVTTHAMYE